MFELSLSLSNVRGRTISTGYPTHNTGQISFEGAIFRILASSSKLIFVKYFNSNCWLDRTVMPNTHTHTHAHLLIQSLIDRLNDYY